MAFDGNGNFLRLHNWTTDAANGVDINASEMDGEDNGFAAGLTNCVTRDGQGKMSVDLTPAVDNTLNLGTLSRRWSSINGVPLPSGNSALNYYPQTAAELAAGVTPTDFSYIPHDLRRLGVVGDGVVDDTANLRKAYLVGGEWKVTAGMQIRITGTITGVKAVRLYSDSPREPLPPTGAPATQAFLIHDFSGTFFDLVADAAHSNIGSGFSFERLCFLQINGNGTGASGTCIRSYGVSAIQRCPWLAMTDCNIENITGSNDWTWNIDCDGTAVANPQNLRDMSFSRMRLVAGANATGAMRLAGLSNIFLWGIEANLSKADLSITGVDATHLCTGIFMAGCTWNNVNIDWVSGVYGAANSAATVTTTVNSTNVDLGCACEGTVPTLLGTKCTVYGKHTTGKWTVSTNNNTRFEMAANTAEFSGPISSDTAVQVGVNPASAGALRLPNGVSSTLSARNAANSGNIDICAVDAANRVQLAPAGALLLWGTPHVALGAGAAPTFGTIGGSGPGTAAQFAWLKVIDDAGNTGFLPYWR